MQQCEFCGKYFKVVKIHQLTCKSNPNKSQHYIESRKYLKGRPGRKWTNAEKVAHSKRMLQAVKEHPESYKGHYHKHCIKYNGKVYDSSWEVLARKYFDNNFLTVTRDVKARIPYWYKKAYHTYIPDFYLLKLGVYVEVKGLVTKKDIVKWKQFPSNKRLLILTKKSIHSIKQKRKLGLVKAIRNSNAQILIDGVPVDTLDNLSVTYLKKVSKTLRLSKEQRSERIKQGIRKSKICKQRRQQARLKQIAQKKRLNASYTGKCNSQYGTFWITNGTDNKKWKAPLGRIPKGFYKGRTCSK